jgi:hypothetical protein
MTELEKKKECLAKYEEALDEILLGNRLTKGDVDGVGNAEFQSVSPEFLKKRIREIKGEIARLEGRRIRISGTPTNMGRW